MPQDSKSYWAISCTPILLKHKIVVHHYSNAQSIHGTGKALYAPVQSVASFLNFIEPLPFYLLTFALNYFTIFNCLAWAHW